MKISFKVAAIVVIAAVILSAPVFAPRVFAQSSPTYTATAGVFTTDVDDSMDVHDYTGVEFEKWTGFVDYYYNQRPLSLGYATRFGTLYLGAWYTGNAASRNSSIENEIVSEYDLATQLLTQKTTTITYTNQRTFSSNSLNVLIGVAGMGFKVGFDEYLTVWDNPRDENNYTFVTTVVEDASGAAKTYTNDFVVDDFKRIYGSMTPSLEWGMSLAAGGLTIKPKVVINFRIDQDTNIYSVRGTGNNYQYSTFNDEVVGAETINYVSGQIYDRLNPSFVVGADFGLSPDVTVGIHYGLDFDIYSNNYDIAGFKGTAKGTVSLYGATSTTESALASTVTTTNGTLAINESTRYAHSIMPSFYYSKEIAEGLKLGFSASIPVGITVSSSNPSRETRNIVKTVYNNDVLRPQGSTVETITRSNGEESKETTSFSISLNAAVGATYALVPGRFTVSAGIGLAPFRYTGTTVTSTRTSNTSTVTVKSYDAVDKLVSEVVSLQNDPSTDDTSDSVYVRNDWQPFGIGAAGGFTFNFNENAAIDMVVNSGAGSSNFELNLSNVKVLFSFKF